jgi:hypothetical protein
MAARAGLRALRFSTFRQTFQQSFARRWQSTVPEAGVPLEAVKKPESTNPFAWSSPVGPKTVHFW